VLGARDDSQGGSGSHRRRAGEVDPGRRDRDPEARLDQLENAPDGDAREALSLPPRSAVREDPESRETFRHAGSKRHGRRRRDSTDRQLPQLQTKRYAETQSLPRLERHSDLDDGLPCVASRARLKSEIWAHDVDILLEPGAATRTRRASARSDGRRTHSPRSPWRRLGDSVADPGRRFDHFGLSQFASETADGDLDGLGEGVGVFVPDVSK
jgi:hypothetical protein